LTKVKMIFFIAVDDRSQTVQRGWSVAVVWIQCASVSAREGRRRDKALLEDIVETASLS
jgi:hypothetical protein